MSAAIDSAPARRAARLGDRALAGLLGALTVALLLLTAAPIGLTWDEPVYLVAQRSYVGWLSDLRRDPQSALSRGGIQSGWEINHEHPPLDKLWSGLVASVADRWLDPLTAGRLGNMLLVGGMVALLYLMVAEPYGRLAGLLAVVGLLSMPRFFFHAHLAALDMPAAATYVAIISLCWHTRAASGWRPSLLVGLLLALVWGAALATKVNAAFALPALGLWALLARLRPGLIGRLALMALIGPWVFIALWPWLYHDTWQRLDAYIRFMTVDHWQIDQLYLGQIHMPPPWHFPFVMLVMVLPVGLLLAAVGGAARGWRDRRPDAPALLWALAALMPLAALTTGRSMVYDNERLFMPAFPFLAALAGAGLAGAIERMRARRLAPAALLAGALAPQLIQGAALYPHLLSYYSETVGGLPGATRLGMETTYWCETYAQALRHINANARRGAVVWAEDWSHDVLLTYQRHGLLRDDLRIAAPEGAGSAVPGGGARIVRADIWAADYVIVQVRESGFTDDTRRYRAEREPVLQVVRQGVTLMELYERR